MAMHTFGLTAGRINKFKGEILKHAIPCEIFARQGRQIRMPKNSSDTYVARRFVPYGATTTSATTQNRFFQDGNGDRANTVVQAHLTQEGITPLPESLTPVDQSVVLQQFSCLYGYTDKTADVYEDDIPAQMKIQIGERAAFVNEMILYGQLKASTNQFYGGTGTTIATVNGKITLNLLRKIAVNLVGNHGKSVKKILKAGPDFNTSPVFEAFCVFIPSDMEPDVRDLANFTAVEQYASGSPMPYEIGKVERFRFMVHPDLPSQQNGGASVAGTGLKSTSASNLDVYQFIVLAEDAFSQIALRGTDVMKPSVVPTGTSSSSDVFGQRGYVGMIWWKAVLRENDGWMAVGNVGITAL